MTLRDMQRDIRKGDFSRGAVSSRIPYVGRPKTVAGRAGAAVGKYPKTSATVGGLTLVALGAGGTKMYDGRDKKFSRKVSKKWEKEDTASVGIGGAAGAAVMPTRQPKAHGQRKYALNEMYSRAERAATDGVADIKISPTELGQTAEHKGRRAYNKGYTAASAVWNGHPADARYEIDMYKDKKGNIRTRQVNGRHLAEVRNMQEQDIPTRVRLVEGEAPESPAFKTAMRYIRSRKERRQLRDERNLNPDTIKSRAKAYEGRLGSVARVANEKAHRYLHKPGETPIKVGKPHLRGRQAAYIAGGAGTMYVGNRLLRGENRGPTQQITSASNKYSDLARKKVAEAIDPVNKSLPSVLKKPGSAGLTLLRIPEESPSREYLHYRLLAHNHGAVDVKGMLRSKDPKSRYHALRAGTNAGKAFKDMSRSNLKAYERDPAVFSRVVTKRDNKDRYAAGAGGALASAAAMPVRESAGGPGAKVAERLRDLPEGMQEVKSSDIMDVAAPGVRRGNKDYTTRMAADIHRGTWDPEPGRIQITDDGVRVTGGQHRAVARAWAGQPTQRMEVVRTPGRMGGTSPGVVAAAKQVKRRLAPMWYKRNAPKSTKELLERDAKGSEKKIAHAKGHSTPSKAALDPVMDLKGLRRLHRKQAAIVAGGTAAALGANEYRRWYTGQDSIMKAAPIRFKKVDFVESAHRSEKGYTMKKKAQGHAQRVMFTPVEKGLPSVLKPLARQRMVQETNRIASAAQAADRRAKTMANLSPEMQKKAKQAEWNKPLKPINLTASEARIARNVHGKIHGPEIKQRRIAAETAKTKLDLMRPTQQDLAHSHAYRNYDPGEHMFLSDDEMSGLTRIKKEPRFKNIVDADRNRVDAMHSFDAWKHPTYDHLRDVSKGARMQAFKVGAKNFHPIRNRIDRAVAERSRLAGQNFTQGAADAMKANMPKVDTNIGAVGEGIKRAGQAVGVGAGTGGLVAGASKVIGDALGANATRKAASESTKRAKYYAGAGLGGAGLIGGGLALNRRK